MGVSNVNGIEFLRIVRDLMLEHSEHEKQRKPLNKLRHMSA